MFRRVVIHLVFLLLSNYFIIIKAESIADDIRRINSQISSLNNEENLKFMLNNGGIFNCGNTYCSQISFIQSQTKKNQIQKFPQINIINSNTALDLSNIVIVKIFSKYNFASDSSNYNSGLKSISTIKYFNLYLFEDDKIIDTISPSSVGYNNLLVYLPLYLSDSIKNKILSISGQNPDSDLEDLKDYDIFDPESKFYNDICNPITFSVSSEDVDGVDSLKNLDITLQQRKKYYFPGNLFLCPSGCSYYGIDKTTISSVCECNEEYFTNILYGENIENEEYTSFNFDEKDFYNSKKDTYFSLNTLKCLKLPFTSSGFKNNYAAIGVIIIAIVVILCFLILIFIGKEHLIFVLELLSNSIPKKNKIFMNDIIEIKNNEKYNKQIISKPENDVLLSNHEMMVSHSPYGRKNKKRKSSKINNKKNEYKSDDKDKKNPPKKKYSLIGDGVMDFGGNRSQMRNIMEEFNKEEEKKEEEKKEEEKKEEIKEEPPQVVNIVNDNQEEILKLREEYEKQLAKLKEKNEKDMKKLEQEKDKKIQKLQNDLENLKNSQVKQVATNNNNNIYKTNDKEVNTLLVSVPLNSLFTEQELNSMDLNQSLNYDKRGFFQIYFSFINMKQPLFYLFNYYTKNKNNNFRIKFNSLRIIIFCYEIMIYLFLYSTFFGSKSITKIFFGTFNFGKKCALGLILAPFCMIIKSVMYYFIYNPLNKRIILVKLKCYSYFIFEKNKVSNDELDGITPINNNENNQIILQNNDNNNEKFGEKQIYQRDNLNNEFIDNVQELIDYFQKKFFLFFGISIIVMFFEWCVVSSFCSVYKNSQIEFFASILVGYLFANIYAFIYCFIPTALRYFALKKNSDLLFKIAEVAKII